MNRDHVAALTRVGLSPTQILALCLADTEQTIAVMLSDIMSCDALELLRQARRHVQNAVSCLDALAPRPDHDFETCAGCDLCDAPIGYVLPTEKKAFSDPATCAAKASGWTSPASSGPGFVMLLPCEECGTIHHGPPLSTEKSIPSSLGGAEGMHTVAEVASGAHSVTPDPAGRP